MTDWSRLTHAYGPAEGRSWPAVATPCGPNTPRPRDVDFAVAERVFD
ncbi:MULTISPECIES: hypothetical protein [unclassified Saccharothrix]